MAFHVGQKVTPKSNDPWLSLDGSPDTSGPNPGDELLIHEIYGDEDGTWLAFREWPHDDFDYDDFRPVRSARD